MLFDSRENFIIQQCDEYKKFYGIQEMEAPVVEPFEHSVYKTRHSLVGQLEGRLELYVRGSSEFRRNFCQEIEFSVKFVTVALVNQRELIMAMD